MAIKSIPFDSPTALCYSTPKRSLSNSLHEALIMPIFDPLNYSCTPLSLSVLAVGAGMLLLGTLVMLRERLSRIAVRYWLLTVAISTWLLSYSMAYAALRDVAVLQWLRLGSLGVVFIPPALLALVACIVQQEREVRPFIGAGAGLSLLFTAAVFVPGFFVTGLYRYSWGPAARYGWPGVLVILFLYVFSGLAFVLILREYRRSTHPINRRRLKWVLIAFSVGFLATLDFAVNLGIPLYPAGFAAIAVYVISSFLLMVRDRLVFLTPEVVMKEVLETMQGAAIVVDLEGRVRVVNRAAEEMLGYRKADLVGRDLASLEIIPPEVQAGALAGDRAASRELVWTDGGGRRTVVSVAASIVIDERSRTPVGVVYVAHNITRRFEAEERLKRFAEELQAANRQLEGLDRMKSDFVSVVSHELRTPITAIKAFVDILQIKPDMPPDRKMKMLRTVSEESDRLGRLINDLLDLSRIESGSIAWHEGTLSVADIIRTSVEGITPLAANKGIEIVTAVADALPELRGDRDRIVQVMTNLLSNAVKFTPAGGRISVAARSEPGPPELVVVAVSDTGRGIPEKDFPLIFDKFHRSENGDSDMIEGIGLGLNISRQIVEHHGGRIWAESVPGEGSTFRFSIPVSTGGKGTTQERR
jgi:PAS domain S-box-containing protein